MYSINASFYLTALKNYSILLCIQVEATIRQNGAIPATIALINGTIHVGLKRNHLLTLGEAANTVKVAARDLAHGIANNLTGKQLHYYNLTKSRTIAGGTTVSATMQISHLVGIEVFVTGGIGGVHRHAEVGPIILICYKKH